MNYLVRLTILGVGTALSLFAAGCLFLSRSDPVEPTGLSVFVLEPFFPAGRRLRKRVRKKDRSSRDRYRKLLELYTPGEADRVLSQAESAGPTYALLLTPLIILLLAVTGDLLLFVVEAVLLAGLCLYFDYWLDSTVKKRHAELLSQYPAMLTEMSLMVNVGITAAEAFDRVAVSSDGLLFREMQRVTECVRNGMPVDEALDNLSTRAPLREMKKFVSLYKQNLVKGGPDFPRTLSEMAAGAWTDRKNSARTKGELAEQKLLLPTLFMFVGILLMIIVPAFRNLF